MDEYIEREAAYEAIMSEPPDAHYPHWYADKIKAILAADVETVVHAEWLDIVFDPMWRSMSATCSHCMVRGEVRVKSNECGFAVPDSDYCPHCGARMDLKHN